MQSQCLFIFVEKSILYVNNISISKMFVLQFSFSIFFSLQNKITLCGHSRCLSVRPSSVEITLERGSDRSAEPIDLKLGLNMGNWEIHV